jgi:hypothetical protein
MEAYTALISNLPLTNEPAQNQLLDIGQCQAALILQTVLI